MAFDEVEHIFQDLEADSVKILKKEAGDEVLHFERSLDMRFVGQGSEINVLLPAGYFTRLEKAEVRRLFDEAYEKLYGRTYPDSEVEFINFKVKASLPERLLKLPKIEGAKRRSLDTAVKGQRQAYSPLARKFIPYTVYDRYRLFPGARFSGPAIIEERESTLIVGEDARMSTDDFGFLWIDLKESD